jgi:hypothetical protein
VCGQASNLSSEKACTPFPLNGGLRYVRYSSFAGMIPDHMPSLPLQWLRLIVENRPNYGEKVRDLNDINDIRNGVFAAAQVHTAFEPRYVVVLKVRRICLTDVFVASPLYLA